MNARILALVALFALATSIESFAVPADLVSSMSALDKKYIPALGLSGQADQLAKAKVAFLDFERAWIDFDNRFAPQAGFDAEWGEDLATIGEAVTKAKAALIENSNGPVAHEALEGVRMTFLASRTRQKIPYFIDSLTLYHNSMEDLLNDKPGTRLVDWSEAEKMGFAADLDIAIARWKKAKASEGLLPQAALSAKAGAVYLSQWQAVDAIMAGAKKAFEAGDEKVLADRLGQLKPAFIKTFFLFGEFPQ
jgi:hypothetical protein